LFSAAEQDTKWSSTSKQMLTDLSTTLTKSVVMLDKQLNSIPNNLRSNKAVLAGFNETKVVSLMLPAICSNKADFSIFCFCLFFSFSSKEFNK